MQANKELSDLEHRRQLAQAEAIMSQMFDHEVAQRQREQLKRQRP